MTPAHDSTSRWLSVRTRFFCVAILVVSSLLPPYIPKAALAPAEAGATSQNFLLLEEGFIMKSSSLTDQESRRAYAEGSYHIVKEGESLERLSERYGVSVNTIRFANDLEEGTSIQPGDELLILPVDGVLHQVKRGQTLIGIAELYGIESGTISQQNQLEGGFIMAGQELIIPGGSPLPEAPPPTQIADQPDPAPPAQEPSAPASPPPAAEPGTAVAPVAQVPEAAYTATPTKGVLQKPCTSSCYITQYYHGGHFALDMQDKNGGNFGGPIYAAEAGTIIRADTGWNGGYGNVIEVDHGNGLVTLYGHNKTLHVGVGDTVERGQQIADMGNTGLVYGRTGIHVHFEVRQRGVKKNPLLYIQ